MGRQPLPPGGDPRVSTKGLPAVRHPGAHGADPHCNELFPPCSRQALTAAPPDNSTLPHTHVRCCPGSLQSSVLMRAKPGEDHAPNLACAPRPLLQSVRWQRLGLRLSATHEHTRGQLLPFTCRLPAPPDPDLPECCSSGSAALCTDCVKPNYDWPACAECMDGFYKNSTDDCGGWRGGPRFL